MQSHFNQIAIMFLSISLCGCAVDSNVSFMPDILKQRAPKATKSSSHLTLAQSFAATSPLYSHRPPSQPTSSFRSQYRPRMVAGQLVFGRPSTALRADRWGSKHFLLTLTTVRSGAVSTSMITIGVPAKCTSQSEPNFFFTWDSTSQTHGSIHGSVPECLISEPRLSSIRCPARCSPKVPGTRPVKYLLGNNPPCHADFVKLRVRRSKDGQRIIRKHPGQRLAHAAASPVVRENLNLHDQECLTPRVRPETLGRIAPFLSMRRIDARCKNARAFLLRFFQSLASLRQRLSHARCARRPLLESGHHS